MRQDQVRASWQVSGCGPGLPPCLPISIAPLGSAHSLLGVRPGVQGRFALLNSCMSSLRFGGDPCVSCSPPGKPLPQDWLCSHLPPDRESPPDPARGPNRPGTSGVCFFHDCLPTTLGLVEGRAWVLSGWVERGRKGSKGFGDRHRGGSLCTLWWASPPLSPRALVTFTLSPCTFSPACLLGSIAPNLFSSLPSPKPAPMHPSCSRTLPFTASLDWHPI